MRKARLAYVAWAVLLSAATLWAQATRPTTPSPKTTTKENKQEPCWKQAGISQSALQQRREIAQQTHRQIEAVCANSSLTAQQKQQQIRQIREEAHARMDKLVSPSQMEALKSCRAKRGRGGTPQQARRTGPCGEMLMNEKGSGKRGAKPPNESGPEEEP